MDLDFHSKRPNCFVIMDTGPIWVLSRINPFVSDLSSFRGCEYSRHELVQPYPAKWISCIVTKNCPGEFFFFKKKSVVTSLSSLKKVFFSTFSSCCRTECHRAPALNIGDLVRFDTSADGT